MYLRQNSRIGFEELFNSIQRRPLNSGTLLLDGSIPVCPEDPKPTVRKYWINPRSSFVQFGHHAWDRRSTDASNFRYLDLVDVALKLEKATASVEPALDTSESDS